MDSCIIGSGDLLELKTMVTSVNDIRSAFLSFFENEKHKIVKSSGLVPDNDPTLMFTNAGMVQFKDVFTGKKNLKIKRATTAQKCLRAGGKHNDLDNVGYTARHHTFFEMLGNFSFGDYFKDEAINFAWNLVTKTLGLDPNRLLVTVHSSDSDAANIWKKVTGFSDSKIIRIPTNDNFWSMGETGPCGPCTEIFYDHGDRIYGGPPGSKEEDGDRFIEIWNLVFMQFETQSDGSRINLPKPSIDTGMGLERIAAVLQGVHNNYDIDLFQKIIENIKNITKRDDPKYTAHNNVIADHIRAISFMIADGITPSNEGRGYVLRRIIRRALRHGYIMGIKDPFLYKLVPALKNIMGDHYTELRERESVISQVLENEEKGFMKTIDKGMSILQTELNKLGSKKEFSPEIAYKLYDTYGFPIDLTQDILRNIGKHVDENEFQKISRKQSELAKKAWVGTGDSFTDKVWFEIAESNGKTEFKRDVYTLDSEIVAIVKNSKKIESSEHEEGVFIVTKETPFYAESGGQVGDIGTISNETFVAKVIDTKSIDGVIAHKAIVTEGSVSIGNKVKMEIDRQHRLACSKNHTSTHLLQSALRSILGTHVAQKGSMVGPDRLRFDFIHSGPIDKNKIQDIENIVLDEIDNASTVSTEIMNLEDAKKTGAMALFGEKYQDTVRVVSIGTFSKELCGGTHVSNTSQIGGFKILSVSSVGSGIKRIEAISGRSIRTYLESKIDKLEQRVSEQTAQIREFEKQIETINTENKSKNLEIHQEDIDGIEFDFAELSDVDHKIILNVIDKAKASEQKICMLISNKSSKNGKLSVCIFVSSTLHNLFNAKKLLDSLELGLKFGGRDELVQFGGIEIESFRKIVLGSRNYIKEKAWKKN